MAVGILRSNRIAPTDPRRAYVENLALRIDERATRVAPSAAPAYGMPIALSRGEPERLYGAAGLHPYRPEAVRAHGLDGRSIPAWCDNLLTVLRPAERNPTYAAPLQKDLGHLGFPAQSVRSIVNH